MVNSADPCVVAAVLYPQQQQTDVTAEEVIPLYALHTLLLIQFSGAWRLSRSV